MSDRLQMDSNCYAIDTEKNLLVKERRHKCGEHKLQSSPIMKQYVCLPRPSEQVLVRGYFH